MSVFEFSGIFGSILSGMITDYIYHKYKSIHESTKIRMSLVRYFFIITIVTFHFFNYNLNKNSSDLFLITIGFVFGFCCYGSIALLGVIAMEFTSVNFSGTSHAIAALSANIGAVVAGIPFGYISRLYTWSYAFKLVELLTLIITVVLFIFRNSKSKFEYINNISEYRKNK